MLAGASFVISRRLGSVDSWHVPSVIVSLSEARHPRLYAVDALTSGGQVMSGASASFTVTVKEQEVLFPDPSVTVNVFVVIPIGKVLPEASPAVCVVVAVQLSVPTGAV